MSNPKENTIEIFIEKNNLQSTCIQDELLMRLNMTNIILNIHKDYSLPKHFIDHFRFSISFLHNFFQKIYELCGLFLFF